MFSALTVLYGKYSTGSTFDFKWYTCNYNDYNYIDILKRVFIVDILLNACVLPVSNTSLPIEYEDINSNLVIWYKQL